MTTVRPKTKRELVRFYRFSIVGTIGAVVDFGTFNLLTSLLGIWSVLASVISFLAAVTSNFLWNRYWTYPDSRTKRVHHQAIQFALVNLVGLAIRTPIFALTEAPAGRLAERLISMSSQLRLLAPLVVVDPAIIGRNLALALAVLVVLLWNFGINRIWTYSDVS